MVFDRRVPRGGRLHSNESGGRPSRRSGGPTGRPFRVFDGQSNARVQDYFLGSSNGVRFFFEEDAFDESNLTVPIGRANNKIGHALHDKNERFYRFSRDPRLATICAALGQRDPKLVQSMYIFKQPHVGGEVVWHQDSTFLHTAPLSVVGFWFALEDADRTNGCLWALPGAHKLGLKERWKLSSGAMTFESLREVDWPMEQAQPLEVPQGTLVVLHGELPHWSAPNRTVRSRHAYTLHVVDGRATYSRQLAKATRGGPVPRILT